MNNFEILHLQTSTLLLLTFVQKQVIDLSAKINVLYVENLCMHSIQSNSMSRNCVLNKNIRVTYFRNLVVKILHRTHSTFNNKKMYYLNEDFAHELVLVLIVYEMFLAFTVYNAARYMKFVVKNL